MGRFPEASNGSDMGIPWEMCKVNNETTRHKTWVNNLPGNKFPEQHESHRMVMDHAHVQTPWKARHYPGAQSPVTIITYAKHAS